MNIAFPYRRVSTDVQDYSMKVQDALLSEYCRRQELTISITLEDEDVSGSIPMAERVGGGQLLRTIEAAVRNGDGTQQLHLVTTKQDRLGRDTIDQIATIRRLWDLGVTPHFVSEGGAFPRTSQNELLFEIKASVAQYERNLIRERTRAVLNHKRALGELVGSVPYGGQARYHFADGYELPSNTAMTLAELAPWVRDHGAVARKLLVELPEEVEVLRRIVPLRYPDWPATVTRLHVSWKLARICMMLNLEGVPSKTGLLWGAGSLDGVLRSKFTRLVLTTAE